MQAWQNRKLQSEGVVSQPARRDGRTHTPQVVSNGKSVIARSLRSWEKPSCVLGHTPDAATRPAAFIAIAMGCPIHRNPSLDRRRRHGHALWLRWIGGLALAHLKRFRILQADGYAHGSLGRGQAPKHTPRYLHVLFFLLHRSQLKLIELYWIEPEPHIVHPDLLVTDTICPRKRVLDVRDDIIG